MKSKELIRLLQEEDPSGETEVCCGNHDIYFVESQEAYYDGNLQLLIIDESKKPYYCISGAKVISSGRKIKLHTMGVEDVILNDPDVRIDLEDLRQNHPSAYERWKQRVEEWREETRKTIAEIDEKYGKRN